jgi:hypothetical protein
MGHGPYHSTYVPTAFVVRELDRTRKPEFPVSRHFIGGLRYGDGTLYTRNAGDVRVFWEGPSIGFDAGADGARTMMLVYNLPQVGAIFDRFGGINGSAYFIGGFGMTALTANHIVVVPIRSGIGLRLGANLGYLKFTDSPTWNPF